jgi:hypothetical protein
MIKNDDYLIEYSDIKDMSIDKFLEKLESKTGLPLSDCTISKLVFYNGVPILTGNGVYIFKNDKRYLYVGKCSSRSFVERIPAHFDIRNTAWFNSFLKKLINIEKINQNIEIIKPWFIKNDPKINEDKVALLKKQAKKSLENHQLILINFKPDNKIKENIIKLEYILRIVLEPINKIQNEDINTKQKICDFKKK